MKRLLFSSLILCLLLTGCVRWNGNINLSSDPSGSEGGSEPTDSTDPQAQEVFAPIGDMSGATVIIAAADISFLTSDGEYPSDAAIAERNGKVEQDYHCKIAVSKRTDEQIYNELVSANGSYYADIISVSLEWYGRFAESGLLLPISDFPEIDAGAPYFTDDPEFYHKGKTFTLRSAASPWTDAVYCLYYNKRIASEQGLDLDVTANEDKLTWDYVLSVCEPGDICVISDEALTRCIFTSCGMTYTGYNDGRRTCDYIGEGSDYTSQLTKSVKNTYLSQSDDALTAFYSGGSLFYLAPASAVRSLADMPDSFGVLPLPKREGTADYRSYTDLSAQVLCIPVGAGENAGGIYADLAACSADGTKSAYLSELASFYLRDNQSALNLSRVLESAKTDYAYLFGYYDAAANSTAWAYEYILENGGSLKLLYDRYADDLLAFANVN